MEAELDWNPGLSVAGISVLSSTLRMKGIPWSGLIPRALAPAGKPGHPQSLQHAFSHQAGAATWVRKTPSSLPTSRVEYELCFGHFWANTLISLNLNLLICTVETITMITVK